MYVMMCTRPYIADAMGFVSRYMKKLGKESWKAIKWILRYLRGTATKSLCFGGSNTVLQGYVDLDMTVTTKVPFILQITQPSILKLNIYNSSTIS